MEKYWIYIMGGGGWGGGCVCLQKDREHTADSASIYALDAIK